MPGAVFSIKVWFPSSRAQGVCQAEVQSLFYEL